jgi:hypothetical protein
MSKTTPTVGRIAYSKQELASALGRSVRTIEREIAAGHLRTFRCAGRDMIAAAEVERYTGQAA